MKKSLFFIVLLFLVFSCNNNKKLEETNLRYGEENSHKNFIILIDAIVAKDDKFHLMYLTDEVTSWSSQCLIKKEIKGQDVAQTIEFKLPKGVFPTKFRVDLGFNKAQKNIDLYKIRFQFDDNEMVLEEHMIEGSFISNVYAKYSKGNKADLIFSEVNGKYNPLIIATDHFMNRLNIKL